MMIRSFWYESLQNIKAVRCHLCNTIFWIVQSIICILKIKFRKSLKPDIIVYAMAKLRLTYTLKFFIKLSKQSITLSILFNTHHMV